ncbi:MAG: putative rhamnosyl transferase [Gammaproteobacteria bacterium]|nr:putative rhamnosyl transferase [Gammaproteobacteria bacterium]MDH3447632.1 putative rhamnosyl transferase [Gammaproteobacteria bacterium]
MKKIQHFVLTRFNLRLEELSQDLSTDKTGRKIDRDEWLTHRFGLFERYCLPSMTAQKNRDFQWLLFFDESTPERFRNRIEADSAVCPQIRIFYIKGTHIHGHLMDLVDPDTDVLITTRLDNDDAFHEDALQVIREQVQNTRSNLCVNLRFGLELKGNEAEVISHRYNPFSSMIEFPENGEYRTIFATAHGKISSIAPVRQIVDQPYWLRVIHDRNITNREGEAFARPSMRDFKSMRRYLKNRVLIKLRRGLWPNELRRKYGIDEIRQKFHIGDLSS